MRKPTRAFVGLLGAVAISSAAWAFISSPQPVDASIGLEAPPVGNQSDLRAAPLDGGWMLVWTDARAAPGTSDVYGTTVQASGAWAPPAGRPLASEPGAQRSASVACGADRCVVAWVSGREVRARRFSWDGTPIDPAPLTLATNVNPQRTEVAHSAGEFLVVWTNGGDLAGAQLSLTGPPTPRPIQASAGVFRAGLFVAGGPAGWAVVWCEGGLLFAAVVNLGGGVSAPRSFAPGGSGTPARIVWNGVGWTAVWTSLARTYSGNLFSRQLSAAGVPLGAVVGALDAGDGAAENIGLTSFGAGLLVSHHTIGGALGTFVTPLDLGGVAVGPTQSTSTATSDNAFNQVVAGPAGILLAWQDGFEATAFDLSTRRLQVTGAPLDAPRGMGWVPHGHVQASVAASDAGFLVAWQDNARAADGGTFDINAAVLDFAGTPTAATIGVAVTPSAEYSPLALWNGATFGVAWLRVDGYFRGAPALLYAPVSTQGVRGAPVNLTPNNTCCGGSLSWAPGRTLGWVVGSLFDGVGLRAIGFRVGVDGALLDPQARVLGPGTAHNGVKAAWSEATGTLQLTWVESEIVTQRFDINGVPKEAKVEVSAGNLYPSSPVIASDGQDFLVAWVGGGFTRARRVDGATGAPLGSEFVVGPGSVPDPTEVLAVAYDGREYALAATSDTAANGLEVTVYHLSRTGALRASERLGTSVGDQTYPRLSAGTPGRLGAIHLDPALGVARTQFQVLAAVLPKEPCAVTAECVVGVCAQGFCCDPNAGPCAPVDAGAPDAGAPDAGQRDGGDTDGGSATTDAGPGDAGEADAGRSDGDGGLEAPSRFGLACGCQGVGAPAGWLGWLGLTLLAQGRARRGKRASYVS